MRRALACLVSIALFASLALPAGAQDLEDDDVAERLAFASERLDARKTHAQLWKWGWTAIDVGALVFQSVAAADADKDSDRANGIAQALLAGLGLVDLYVLRPFPGTQGADPARALLDGSAAGRRAALARAEELLVANAERAAGRKRWPLHLGNVAVNAAAGLAVWAAGSGTDGLITGLTGIIGGEVQIWSQPLGRERDLRDYERSFASTPSDPPARLSLVPSRGGFALRLDF